MKNDHHAMLYKHTQAGFCYWDCWHVLKLVTTVSGLVGERAKPSCQHAQDEAAAAAEVRAATASMQSDGYAEIPATGHQQVVVQWKRDTWASEQDLEWRHEVEAVFDDALGSTGLGYCDGGTFGGYKVQVFCLVVDQELGIREMVAALRELERLDGAVLAVPEGATYRVVYPPDHQGGFSVL